MRTSIFGSIVSGFIALSLPACSGANVEPVDQSATAQSAHLDAPPPAGSVADAHDDMGRPDGAHHRGGRRGAPDPAEVVKRFDKNADGVITVEELKAGEEKMRAEHLAKVDTDHDGKVSPEERKAAFEKFAE